MIRIGKNQDVRLGWLVREGKKRCVFEDHHVIFLIVFYDGVRRRTATRRKEARCCRRMYSGNHR